MSDSKPFMADFVDLIYGVFFSPTRTLREFAGRERSPMGVALFAFFLAALINGLANLATARTVLGEFLRGFSEAFGGVGGLGGSAAGAPAFTPGAGFIVASLLLGLAWAPIGLFFKAGALSLTGSFLGGKGQPSRLYAAFALTFVPSIAGVPFALLFGGRSDLTLISTIVSLAILVWRLVLDIIALREVNGFDTGRAVAAALVPLGVLLFVAIAAVLIWLAAFASLLGPLLNSGLPGVG